MGSLSLSGAVPQRIHERVEVSLQAHQRLCHCTVVTPPCADQAEGFCTKSANESKLQAPKGREAAEVVQAQDASVMHPSHTHPFGDKQ